MGYASKQLEVFQAGDRRSADGRKRSRMMIM
jgi:hypothetical protein